MKSIVLICLVAVALAAPPSRVNYSNQDVELLSYENDNDGLGSYKYGFSQSDGTKQEQQGEFNDDDSYVVRGSYSWIAPDGRIYTVTYIADENGYQPEVEEAPGYEPNLVASLLG